MQGFLSAQEHDLTSRFLQDGYVKDDVANRSALDRIQAEAARLAAEHLEIEVPDDPKLFLDSIHGHVSVPTLNALRLAVIDSLLQQDWVRPAILDCARPQLYTLVGNELAMQRNIGLSIQLPGDKSSLLPLHSDVWSEDSPFEVVCWIPLVDCTRTKSMFLLHASEDAAWQDRLHEFGDKGVEAFYDTLKDRLKWLDIDYGQVLVFSHTLIHGNRPNEEDTSRWSLNVRFKGLFTPYSDKRLGDFFEPVTPRPATRFGINYKLPSGFHE